MRRRAVRRAKSRAEGAHPALAPQAKLEVDRSEGPLELEAERVSREVVSGAESVGIGRISRSLRAGPVRAREPLVEAERGVPSEIEGSIASQTAGGVPLRRHERRFFEGRFGTPFAQVRTHSDGTANRLARSLQARAFTVGDHIFFASGQFGLGSSEGRRLLAHELTHTVQQRGSLGRENPLQRDDEGTPPTTITFNFTGALQTPPCGTRRLRATTDGDPVTWSLAAGTAQVDAGTSIAADGTLTIGASQGAGVIEVVATPPVGDGLAEDLHIAARPTGITSTRAEAAPPAGSYGHVFEHVFESSDGNVAHLEGVPVGEKFPGLANPNGLTHVIPNPPYPFDRSYTLHTANLTPDASNNWFLTSAGELGGGHDTISIGHDDIDVGRFVQSASNPRPSGRLPAGFTVDQHLHWYCPQQASAARRWTDFVTVAHSRTLINDGGNLSVVTTVNGVEDGGDDYVGPTAVTNLSASPVSTPRSAGPPAGGGTAPAPRTVRLRVDTLPSPLPGSETLSWSIHGEPLGCSVAPDAADSTQATLTIGTAAGNVTVQVADATDGNFDRVTVRIT